MLKTTAKTVQKVARIALITAIVGLIALQAPQMHRDYIRNKVGSQVVMLVDETGHRGGTGFSVQAPSGQAYILTNAHVCALGEGHIFAKSASSRAIPLRIIERSNNTDLCLLTGLSRLKGLKVAGSVSVGEELGLVGHPKLMPLTLSRGELIGYDVIGVMVDEGPCPKEEGMYKTVNSFFGPVCAEVFKAGLTNILSLPGNSGSPVVNVFGNIVGVLFAGAQDNWGVIVSLDDVKEFLKDY